MIMEADMPTDWYYHTNTEAKSVFQANRYLKEKKICKHLVTVVKKTILTGKGSTIISWDEMR
jgi:hypothetical protein